MPHVTIDCRLLPEAGIGTYLRELVPRLISRSDERWRHHLLGDAAGLRDLPWSAASRPSIAHWNPPMYSIREQLSIGRALPAETDLLWAPHYNVPLLHRRKLLVTIHDVLPLARPALAAGAHRRAALALVLRTVARVAEAILCVSAFTASELSRLTGCDHRKIVVTYPGVDRSWFRVPPGPSPHPRPYLLAVGDVKPHKNYRALIQAFTNVAGAIPHDLLIVGRTGGFRTGDLAALRLAASSNGRVRMLGTLPKEVLQAYCAHAEMLVYPSLYEGFGLPPLEAMACGVPVIASSAGAIPEVCGEAVLYCDPSRPDSIADQISRLAGDSALRADLVGRGGERALRFDWSTTAETTRGVIERVISQ